MAARGILQAATVFAKTTQTDIGSELGVSGYNYLTLFLEYTKGDETGLLVQAHVLRETGGTEFQYCTWANSSGTWSVTAGEHTLTAAADVYITFDVSGIEIIKFTQGGSNNDGTPTGTLAVSYTLK